MRKYNKIFGIGPGKSGTHSLWYALDKLGIPSVHVGNLMHKCGNGFAIANKMFENRDAGRMILDDLPIGSEWQGFDAIMDYPIGCLAKDLDRQYPGSLFILTYRNPDDIAFSWCRMRSKFGIGDTTYKEKAEDARNRYDEMFKYFGQREDFLVLNTNEDRSENLRTLCEFLETTYVASDKYPHKFRSSEWYGRKR